MMTARKQAAVVVGVIGIALALLFAGKRILGNELSPLGPGSEAPNFTALTLDSIPQSKSLDAYKGCHPCQYLGDVVSALPSGDAEYRAATSNAGAARPQGHRCQRR